MSVTLINDDNRTAMYDMFTNKNIAFDLIYADMMYDDYDFNWVFDCEILLKNTGSIFIQTDYRSVAELKVFLTDETAFQFINWIIWPYDWGGRSKRSFARKHDDILWYSLTDSYKFYPERVKIPKKVTSPALNPSGRDWKIPTDVWSDIGNFHTMSKERIKLDEKNIKWQKPERLLERIILSTTDEGDWVLDPFMGTGTTGAVCKKLNRNFVGIELDKEIYSIAKERIQKT